MLNYNQKTILDDLDSADKEDPYKFWFILDHGYFYTAGNRITLFADEKNWAIVFEKSGYANRGTRIEIEITYFGNCLKNLDKAGSDNQFTCNTKYISLMEGSVIDNLSDGFELISKKVENIQIHGQILRVEHDLQKYLNKGIVIRDFENPKKLIDIVSLVRYLDEEYPESFRANDSEIRKCIPQNIPKILTINKWHQKDYGYYDNKILGTKPSRYETFQQIAKVLDTKDTSYWKPTLKPNNHWKNWPKAGGL
jgi:hypothetical protein